MEKSISNCGRQRFISLQNVDMVPLKQEHCQNGRLTCSVIISSIDRRKTFFTELVMTPCYHNCRGQKNIIIKDESFKSSEKAGDDINVCW